MPRLYKHPDRNTCYVLTDVGGSVMAYELTSEGEQKLAAAGIACGQRFARAILLDLHRSGDAYTSSSGVDDPLAYFKAVADKKWEDEYKIRTGKPWKGQDKSKDSTKSDRDINSEKTKLNENECLKLLGLKPGFSQKQLKEAYRQAVKMNHPDKVASLSDEFKALAEKRMKQINQAFELLREE